MDWPRLFLAGVKAAAMGSLTGTGLISLAVIAISLISLAEAGAWGLWLTFLPFLIGFIGAAIGLMVVGLPLTWWLERRGAESRAAYLSAGLIGGAALAGLVMMALAGGGFLRGHRDRCIRGAHRRRDRPFLVAIRAPSGAGQWRRRYRRCA